MSGKARMSGSGKPCVCGGQGWVRDATGHEAVCLDCADPVVRKYADPLTPMVKRRNRNVRVGWRRGAPGGPAVVVGGMERHSNAKAAEFSHLNDETRGQVADQ